MLVSIERLLGDLLGLTVELMVIVLEVKLAEGFSANVEEVGIL